VLQALAQAIAPVGVAISVARQRANPYRPVVAKLNRSRRDIVSPEIEGPAANEIKTRVVPVAGQYSIFDRATVQRETRDAGTGCRVRRTRLDHVQRATDDCRPERRPYPAP
jgi:hypothetical protein